MNKLSFFAIAALWFSVSTALAQSLANPSAVNYEQSSVNTGLSYDQCLEQANGNNIKMTACIVSESNRILKILEEKYEQMANNSTFKSWNNGAGVFNGNFKELFSSWLQYRDKYCSLYGYSTSPDVDQGNIAQLSGAECVLELTKRQNKDMDVILKNVSNF